MLKALAVTIAFAVLAVPALARESVKESTWRAEIKPLVDKHCLACHGPDGPEYNDWKLLGDQRKQVGPRMDSYPHFMSYVVWPATGAMMRRLDDGHTSGGKPGNMYQYLGDSDGERVANLAVIKGWLGEGAWNLNRWQENKGVPGIGKEQLEKIKAKY